MAYSNSIKFAVDGSKVESTLTDFPVRIHLSPSGSGGIDWSDVFVELGSNNKKISIQDSQSNELYTEISYWSPSTSAGIIDFKVPTLSAGDNTEFTFYYDSSVSDNITYVGETGDTAAQSVWDSDYVAVYHMTTDPSLGSISDSTSNEKDGTVNGSMVSNDLIDTPYGGKAWEFDGNDDNFVVTDNDNLLDIGASTSKTIESFINDYASSEHHTIFDKRQSTFPSKGYLIGIGDDNKIHFFIKDINDDDLEQIGDTTLTRDGSTWYHLVGRIDRDETVIQVYLDGSKDTIDINSSSIDDCVNNRNAYFADNSITSTWANFEGAISEIRVSDKIRTQSWLRATNSGLRNELIIPIVEYNNSITFTIDGSKVESTLTDFPVRLYLSPSGSGNIDWSDVFTELGSNNKKISIQDSNGNEHYTEISYWSDSNSKAILDFKVPTLSAGVNQEFIFYYDSIVSDNTTYIGETGDAAAQNVWDSNYVSVHHLVVDPSGTTLDSTSNGNDAIDDGNMDSSDLVDDDLIIKAVDFDDSGGYMFVSSYTETSYTNGMTFEALVNYTNPDKVTNNPFLNQKEVGQTYNICGLYIVESDDKQYFGHRINSGSWQAISTVNAINDNVWYYSAGIYDDSITRTYLKFNDDSLINSFNFTRSTNYDSEIRIGGVSGNSAAIKMGEARISNIDRSNDWLNTTNYTLKDELISTDITNISPSVGLQTLSLSQYGSTQSIDISHDLNLLNLTLNQLSPTTSIDVIPEVNLQSLNLTQQEIVLYSEGNIDVIVDKLNKSLTQLSASVSYTANPFVDLLGLNSNILSSNINISSTKDLNLLSLNFIQPSASVIIDTNVFINLNILEKQMLINAVTTGIINKLIFPIIGDGVDSDEQLNDRTTSITKGINIVTGKEPFKNGLTRVYKPNPFIKGIKIVKR